MKNKNLFTMKQPELGQKILELRKSKGLTQEELVEKCNINVRTIQRIESGEVTPRTFTIKTILEALNVDSNLIFRNNEENNQVQFTSKENRILSTSWLVGIFFLMISVVGVFIEIYLWNEKSTYYELFFRIPYNILYLGTMIFFFQGYKLLGKKYKYEFLTTAVYIYFGIEILITLSTIGIAIFDVNTTTIEIIFGTVLVILIGVGELILGLGILKLKKQFGTFSNVLGILKIVNGGMLISVILSLIAMFLIVPVLIIEIIFIYNLANNKKFYHS